MSVLILWGSENDLGVLVHISNEINKISRKDFFTAYFCYQKYQAQFDTQMGIIVIPGTYGWIITPILWFIPLMVR